jgi:1,2-diacylglycerol 3-beta-glucosyltransferase
MLRTVLDAALLVAAAPFALAAAYLAVLTALSRRTRPPPRAPPHLRFDLVVPAHDEEGGVAATVASLLGVAYPPALRRVLVVADNCSDATATRAAAAGALTIVRDDPARVGKGYALQRAFERSLADGFADAVVVVDADSVVSPDLLDAFAARLDGGAVAVQAHYGVRNAGASWRTRLMAVAFAVFHGVRSLGRERLGCSAGLRGNGMCFATRLLRDVPYAAFSIVEDVEYGIRLGLAGRRVHYAAEALVLGDMAAGAEASGAQRRRWEGGRWRMVAEHAWPLVRRALAGRDLVLLDLATDLVVPPLSTLAAAVAAGCVVALAASAAAGALLVAAVAWCGSAVALAAYVVRGWWLSGTGVAGLAGLLHAPAFLLWKARLALGRAGRTPATWVRTPREHRA